MRAGLFRSLTSLTLAAAVAAGGCRPPAPARSIAGSAGPAGPAPGASAAPAIVARGARPHVPIVDGEPAGLVTAAQPDPKPPAGAAAAAPLPDAEAQALLARLPPLPAAPAAASAPPLPARSAPPPRPGAVTPIAFATPTGRAVADAAIIPLTSPAPAAELPPPQISPQGEITADAEVRVRFSEPMVPVAQVGASATPPVTLTPTVPGTWRWLDTRVLVFQTAGARFPAASNIEVTVPAGVRALSGAALAAPARESFSTAPVQIARLYPAHHARPDSPIAVAFDQRIDPARIAALLSVVGPRDIPIPFRVSSLAEAEALWRANPALAHDHSKLAAQLGGNHVVLAPRTAWPAGARVHIVLKRGAPSLEGPRTSARDRAEPFQVVEPFTLLGISCDPGYEPRLTGRTCAAGDHATAQLSNAVLPASYRAELVQLEGQPFEDHYMSGEAIGFRVPLTPGRTAALAIGAGLRDIYDQPFTGPRRATFAIGPARTHPLLAAQEGLHVLDPRFRIPQWGIQAEAVTSVRVQLYRVEPADYFAYAAFERGERPTPPGQRVLDETHAIGAKRGARLRVDLRPALSAAGLGHVVALASATTVRGTGAEAPAPVRAWIQVTKLGVTARTDRERVHAWVRDVSPGSFLAAREAAQAAVVIEGRGGAAQATTDASGYASFELPPPGATTLPPARPGGPSRTPIALLLATAAGDATFEAIDGPYQRAARNHHAYWYATDDRFTYKPSEKVYVKGWVRWTHDGVNPSLSLPAAGEAVAWTLTDERGTKLASGQAPLSDHGGFDLETALPPTAALGSARFEFSSRGSQHARAISIQEFRAPTFSVALTDDVTHGGAAPLVLGESIEMSAAATYYAGGGLPGASIGWSAQLDPARYEPPGWDGFAFLPGARSDDPPWRRRWPDDVQPFTLATEGALSGASAASIVYGLAALPAGRAATLTVDATVVDVDRARIRATSRPILVHPSAYYVGLRLRPGADVIEAIVTDIDGAAVPGVSIDLAIEGVLGSERYRADAAARETHRCAPVSAAAPVACPFPRKDDHAYFATARIADARGRANSAFYAVPWWGIEDRRADFAVTPDRREYRPGDVAKLEIRSDLVPAVALVSLARRGVISQRRVELTKSPAIVEVPIDASYLQNVHVVVDRMARRPLPRGSAPLPNSAAAGPLPGDASVEIDLPVALDAARLAVRARPEQPLVEPGAPATFEVEVRREGKPVGGAEVALMVVDEAILALSRSPHPDPLAPFYHPIEDGTWKTSTLSLAADGGDDLDSAPGIDRFELSEAVGFGRAGYGSGAGGMASRSTSAPSVRMGAALVKVRKDFRATAVFSPRMRTGPDGRARITVDMPDSLTRFRVVALATADTRYFGKGEGTIVAQRKLNARIVAPRFLTQGDAFSLPVIVQNLDAAPRTVDVAARAANLTARGPAAKRVTIPGGQRAEVRFDFATAARGRATIQTLVAPAADPGAADAGAADASSIDVPVYEPATTEAFAVYGTVDGESRFEQLVVPADVFPDVGGVEVELASTQLQALTDAYWYLYAYPYECAEQRSGRMLATAAMAELLEAFAAPGRPLRTEITAQIARDVSALARHQRPDGGWGYFEGLASDPFVSLQVLAALVAHGVRDTTAKRATAFAEELAAKQLTALARAVAAPATGRAAPAALAVQLGLASHALTTLAATGADVRLRAERLHALATELGTYPIDAKARLLALVAKLPRAQAMRRTLLSALLSAAHETAAAATITARFEESERLLLVSNTRTTALALDALMREAPDHALVAKLVRGLLDGRRGGRWASTQENLAALAALRRYFDAYERDTPAFTGKVWLGTAAYTEQAFTGRSGTRAAAQLPWTQLPPGSMHDVAIGKSGTGRMYYRLGISYAPRRTDLPALDAGFIVRRSYTAIDDPADVTRGPDGRWKIRLGARVQVQLEAVNTTERYAVALVDPLPAGLEAVNDRLAISERAAPGPGRSRWDHVEMRDQRSEVFSMKLAPGRHQFSYTARAATPGTFIAAPAKAEEMYSPETFGRSTGATVTVE